MKTAILIALSLTLAACSGSSRGPALQTAEGPINAACLSSDRKARSRELCGCIQFVANLNLSGRDQALAASFYRDPQSAQDTRQSDRASDEAFWQRYKNYSATAQQICTA